MIKVIQGIPVNITIKKNMKRTLLKVINGQLFVSTSKLDIKLLDDYVLKNKDELIGKMKTSLLYDNFTFFNNQKYEIKFIDEVYKNVIFDDDKILVNKQNAKVLICDLFANYLIEIINKEYSNLQKSFNVTNMPSFRIKRLERAYGQYARKNHQITLDYRLAKYDVKYIILTLYHEMSHIKYYGHGADFYGELEKHISNCKSLQKNMRKIKYNDIY